MRISNKFCVIFQYHLFFTYYNNFPQIIVSKGNFKAFFHVVHSSNIVGVIAIGLEIIIINEINQGVNSLEKTMLPDCRSYLLNIFNMPKGFSMLVSGQKSSMYGSRLHGATGSMQIWTQ